MEPDDIQKLYQTYVSATANNYSKVVSWSNNSGVRHNVAVGLDDKVDLSSIPTRDLLNECYRRRAIERFTYKSSADMYFLKQEPKAREHVVEELIRGMWDCMLRNEKFANDAIHVKEEPNNPQIRTEFTGEIYICKHPTKVRK